MSNTIDFEVSGLELPVPLDLWGRLEGPKPEAGFACDGCSCSPDCWRGYPVVFACIIHDYHYSDEKPLGADWEARLTADAIFYRNLRKVVWYYGGSAGEAERIGWIYWGRVRVWGGRAWRGGPGLCARLRSVWRRVWR
jgi:hypothetical protein